MVEAAHGGSVLAGAVAIQACHGVLASTYVAQAPSIWPPISGSLLMATGSRWKYSHYQHDS